RGTTVGRQPLADDVGQTSPHPDGRFPRKPTGCSSTGTSAKALLATSACAGKTKGAPAGAPSPFPPFPPFSGRYRYPQHAPDVDRIGRQAIGAADRLHRDAMPARDHAQRFTATDRVMPFAGRHVAGVPGAMR